MELRKLGETDIQNVCSLFADCFFDDHFYQPSFPDPATRKEKMIREFFPCISYTVLSGYSFGCFEDGQLAGFVLCFSYFAARESGRPFEEIFPGGDQTFGNIHEKVRPLKQNVLYLLSVAVSPEYQRKGLASVFLDHLLELYGKDYHIASDVSYAASLPMYRRRGFAVQELGEDYYFVSRPASAGAAQPDTQGEIRVLLPDTSWLKDYDICARVLRQEYYIRAARAKQAGRFSWFAPAVPGGGDDPLPVGTGTLTVMTYPELLKLQRALGTARCEERFNGDFLCYLSGEDYDGMPLWNDTLREMVSVRKAEWDVIPDSYIAIPVQYENLEKIQSEARDLQNAHPIERDLQFFLDFRTHYEVGIPSSMKDVDDYSSLKSRLCTYLLDPLSIEVQQEFEPGFTGDEESIGKAARVHLMLTVDLRSRCAVLIWYSLSSPFLLSQYLDNMIRNRLLVIVDGVRINLYDYIRSRYGLLKRGTPKAFLCIPRDKTCLEDYQLASLLAAETIYPDGENFGRITDEDIMRMVRSETGMGQYDRGFVCAWSNVLLQFSPDLSGSLRSRVEEESITLFYMLLLLFEEAAIMITDREIMNLLTDQTIQDPVPFLERVNTVYDEYSSTIEFWDIQVNYPTSQKSLEMIRGAFRTDILFKNMKRNLEHLQMTFASKCDMVDRKDSSRTETSLAILSLLAVFSAWIDGHSYLDTFLTTRFAAAVRPLQKALFFGVLAIAVYAFFHLFGSPKEWLEKWRRRK